MCWDELDGGSLKAIEDYCLDEVLAQCLGLMPTAVEEAAFVTIRFLRKPVELTSARVRHLVSQLRGGARWELAEIEGRQAVRVQSEEGISMSVLSPQEMGMFLAAIET